MQYIYNHIKETLVTTLLPEIYGYVTYIVYYVGCIIITIYLKILIYTRSCCSLIIVCAITDDCGSGLY